MDRDRLNIPVIAGITLGVLTGLVVGIYIYSTSELHCRRNKRLYDSAELIAQCKEQLKEIEGKLESIKTPDSSDI